MALPKPINIIIPAPYCNNILNHGINEGIVKLVTLMIKCNETIIKMKVLQLQIKNLLKGPSTINVANIAIHNVHIPMILHWSIKQFLSIMN
jgi:hypothetical protein